MPLASVEAVCLCVSVCVLVCLPVCLCVCVSAVALLQQRIQWQLECDKVHRIRTTKKWICPLVSSTLNGHGGRVSAVRVGKPLKCHNPHVTAPRLYAATCSSGILLGPAARSRSQRTLHAPAR